MRLGIVGLGGMGSWLARHALNSGIKVTGYDTDRERYTIQEISYANSLEELLEASEIVLIATPPRAAVEVLGRVKEYSAETGWRGGVADTLTFKKKIIPLLESMPRGVRAASIHPLFGPRVSKPWRHKVLVVPVPGREGDIEPFTSLLDTMGLGWEVVDHVEHDRVMGLVIGVPYAIAHALARAVGYDALREAYRVSGTTFKALYLLLTTLGDPEWLPREVLEDPDTRYWVDRLAGELGRVYGRVEEAGRLYDGLYCLVEECL